MEIHNSRTSSRSKWRMGAGEAHLFGSASLANTHHLGASQATRIGGRHCGISRWEKSRGDGERGWVNFYDEAFYVVRGRGRFTCSDPPYEKSEIYDVGPGDYFYTPRPTRLDIEPLSDEPFEWFYCAGLSNGDPSTSEEMAVHNGNEVSFEPWKMGAGEPHLKGSAQLAPTIHLSDTQASVIEGRHCGVARFEKSQGDGVRGWVNWYDEAFYVIGGQGRFTRSDPPYEKSQPYDVGPGDYFYMPRAVRLDIEPLSDEPFEWFYCAGFSGEPAGAAVR